VNCKVVPVDTAQEPLTSDRSNDMTDVTVTNRRPDSSANEDLTKLARHGADTFGYRAHLRIDRRLAQLLLLRVSQINNCTYCLRLHHEAARDAGIPRPLIDTPTAWWETDFHDDAARAALAYAEAITRVADATAADDFGARTTRSPSTSRRRRCSRSSGSSST